MSWDVVVVGGGIMGTVSALELARRGRRVVVLERSVPGAEASSAAAGILGAQLEAHGPGEEADLLLASRALYPGFAAALEDESGVSVGYRRCGGLRVCAPGVRREVELAVAWQRERGLPVELPSAPVEEAISESFAQAVRFVEDGQIDPPRLFAAASVAAARAGVEFRAGAEVRRVIVERERATGVALGGGEVLSCPDVVLAAGSWSSLVAGAAVDDVRPVRGQIVELGLRAPLFSHVVLGPGAYLVPRADGRVLVGSTMERVGFEKRVTAGAVRDLLDAALAIVPGLRDATLLGSWASFRPHSASGPRIGASGIAGLTLATGHHRNGILLAPLTGRRVADAVTGAAPSA